MTLISIYDMIWHSVEKLGENEKNNAENWFRNYT